MKYLGKTFSFAATQQPVSDSDWARAFSRRPPLRVVLLGHSFVGAGCLRALTEARDVRIESVHGYLAREPEDVPCPNVLGAAAGGGLRVTYHDPADPNLSELLTLEADLLICANWRHMVPKGVYKRFPLAVGFHGSDLTDYRGRAAVQRQVADGKVSYTLSLFRLAPRPDEGEPLAHRRVNFSCVPTDDAGVVLAKRQTTFPIVPPVEAVYYAFEPAAYDLTTQLLENYAAWCPTSTR